MNQELNFSPKQWFFAVSFIFEILAGCASVKLRAPAASVEPPTVTEAAVAETPHKYIQFTKSPARPEVFPIEPNADIQRWIKYFSEKDRERFQRFLDRGQAYKTVVENVLSENDMPPELYYLAMIESGYRTDAHSRAKAVGVWQFIAGTASRYGLRVDRHVDERRDPIRATEAAAKYLRDLYNVFGSWHLAMAAYNAGEIRILRAIMKARTRNFWELCESKVLPSETANYVPKFLAVVLIGRDPAKYGFTVSGDGVAYPNLEAVEIPNSIKLKQLAQISGIDLGLLAKVNPQLMNSGTPPQPKTYEIWVPVEAADKVRSLNRVLATLVKTKVRAPASRAEKTVAGIHVVRRGENLSLIAQKYKLSVGHLMRINGLRSSQIRWGMRLRTKAKVYATSVARYVVRRNDNLIGLARKFGTTVTNIRKKNNLRSNQIFAGQVLHIAGQSGGR